MQNQAKQSWVRRGIRILDYLPEAALGITVIVTTITIFAQVIFRYVFNSPIYWADEFAVLIFAWMIFIGTAVAIKYNEQISVDTLVRLLPERFQTGLAILTNIAILLVIVVLFIQGILLTAKTIELKYPAMEISRGFLYISLPLTTPLMGFYLARIIIRDIRRFTRR